MHQCDKTNLFESFEGKRAVSSPSNWSDLKRVPCKTIGWSCENLIDYQAQISDSAIVVAFMFVTSLVITYQVPRALIVAPITHGR
jgi:hypothetical protein